MVHKRDILVACIKRHYDLLIRFAYLDPNAILHPPPSGWSDEQLAIDILRSLGRTETVIDLLRHLPYIKVGYLDRYEIMVETIPINYLRDTKRFRNLTVENCEGKSVHDLYLFLVDANWPASFISLTEGRDGTWWIIDTDEGENPHLTR